MKHLYKSFCLIFLTLFFSCKQDMEIQSVEFIGIDQITKIELYPNSPQLISDGKSELRFKVKCYYTINDTVEVPIPMDRVPISEIKITSSEHKTFGLNEGYTSRGDSDSVRFTCSVGNFTSKQVAVALTSAEQPVFDEIVIPVIFHGIYTERTQNNAKEFTPELVEQILDRANRVFAGELINAPSSCPSNIRFKLDGINMRKILSTQDQYSYIRDNLMTEPSKYLNIWVMDVVPSNLSVSACVPAFTFGDADDIKGLKLKEVSSISEVGQVKPEHVGFAITFANMYQMASGYPTERFEMKLGRYYGLLPTWHFDEETNLLVNGDLDYCPDTYSYISKYMTLEKRTFPIKGVKNDYYYDSYNIIDEISSCTTISRDQVKRVRQVINDCAFRQMR